MTTAHTHTGRVRALTAAALLGIFIIHLLRLFAFFGGFDQVLSPEPLIFHDHGWHYYYAVIGSRYLAATGALSGYDPSFMAGYPNDVFDSSDRLLKVLLALLPLSDVIGYKVAVLFTSAVFPFVIFFAARFLDRNRLEAVLAAACGTWAWWSGIGIPFFEIGMIGFLLASSFAFLVFGLLFRFLQRPSVSRGAGLAVGLGFGFLLHPGIVPLLLLPGGALLFLRRRELDFKLVAALAAAGGFALAVNSFWLLPLFYNLKFTVSSATHLQFPLFFLEMLTAAARRGQIGSGWVAVGAVLGLRQWRREGRRELVVVFSLTMVTLALIVLLGSLLPLVRGSQPVRYGTPLFFAACLPAAAWLERLARTAAAPGKGRTRARTILAAAAASFAVGFVLPARAPDASPFVGVGPDVAAVRDWIIRSTDRSARVMVEDRGPITPVFADTYPLGYIALATDRELIGGPHWATFINYHYADLSGITLFGREVRTWPGPELAEEMTRFNVGWVVVRSPLVVQLFDRYPDLFLPLGRAGEFRCYRYVRPRGFVIEGSGTVRADRFRLSVMGAKTQRGKVVLSYHWHPCLQVDPPRRLFRAMIGNDPVGFVGVEGEGGDYDLRLRYPLFNGGR